MKIRITVSQYNWMSSIKKKQTDKKATGTRVFTKNSSSSPFQKFKDRQQSQTHFSICVKPQFSQDGTDYVSCMCKSKILWSSKTNNRFGCKMFKLHLDPRKTQLSKKFFLYGVKDVNELIWMDYCIQGKTDKLSQGNHVSGWKLKAEVRRCAGHLETEDAICLRFFSAFSCQLPLTKAQSCKR